MTEKKTKKRSADAPAQRAVYLTDQEWEALGEYTKKLGMPRATWIKMIILEHLNRELKKDKEE